MGTYNSYVNKSANVGGNIPVWLGKVSPIPVGGVLASAFAKAGAFFPAGMPVELKSGVVTPLIAFKVLAYTTSSTNSIITVKATYGNAKPATTDFLQKLGSKFSDTSKAWNPDSIAANDDDDAAWDITVATANIDEVAEGDILCYSSATAEGASKSVKVQPNGYLYNDICIDPAYEGESVDNIQASAAVVKFHGEGLLINRTPSAIFAKQMLAAVPNVIQDDRF